jgi:extradiol dioxygenase family protein
MTIERDIELVEMAVDHFGVLISKEAWENIKRALNIKECFFKKSCGYIRYYGKCFGEKCNAYTPKNIDKILNL